MIATIQQNTRDSVIGKADFNQKMNAREQEFQGQMENLRKEFEAQVKSKNEEISNLTQAGQELELKIQLADNDFKNQITNLNETLFSLEKERNDLLETNKGLEEQKGKILDEATENSSKQVNDLMRQLEERERENEQQIQEINKTSEDQLAQLKSFFESEKKRLE